MCRSRRTAGSQSARVRSVASSNAREAGTGRTVSACASTMPSGGVVGFGPRLGLGLYGRRGRRPARRGQQEGRGGGQRDDGGAGHERPGVASGEGGRRGGRGEHGLAAGGGNGGQGGQADRAADLAVVLSSPEARPACSRGTPAVAA